MYICGAVHMYTCMHLFLYSTNAYVRPQIVLEYTNSRDSKNKHTHICTKIAYLLVHRIDVYTYKCGTLFLTHSFSPKLNFPIKYFPSKVVQPYNTRTEYLFMFTLYAE